jgi:hypothetical protein
MGISPIVEEVEMSLKMIFVQPTALDLNQELTREGITEEQIGTPPIDYNLSLERE